MKELILIGFALLFLGILAIIAGIMLGSGDSRAESAGIVMIGPIPIMFGSKRLLYPLAIIAIILMVVAYFLFWRR